MHQHCARIDELLDLQVLKGIDQALRAVYRNLLIERVRLARDVIIGRKVDDRGDAVTEPLPNVGNRRSDAILRAEIEVDCDGAVGRFRGSIAIKPHDGVASGKPAYHRGTAEAARYCHEDNFAVVAPWLMLFDDRKSTRLNSSH